MEYGNYGYKDEITRAGWRTARVGMAEEIPLRHWHLNDPGVVPNLLQTGAGSPTGICVYEGDLLPKVFLGQPIHCDAGPNVFRAYAAEPDGAGYRAEMVNILKNTTDRWFRPSDVCVAPDGSLLVADWYDPGVGGHAMGDLERGRIFRLIPHGHSGYDVPAMKLGTPEDAMESLFSPNEETRYRAWRALREMGPEAKPALVKTFRGAGRAAHERARVLWLLARLDLGEAMRALSDRDEKIRVTALRAVRQVAPERALEAVAELVEDEDAQVRRECALALRFEGSARANRLWARLAAQHDGEDRWMLEALGIGADLHWDARLAAAANAGVDLPWDVSWRARGSGGSPLTESLVRGMLPDEFPESKALRSYHFLPDRAAVERDFAVLFSEGGSTETALFAAAQLGPEKIEALGGEERLQALLEPVRGQPEFVRLAARLNLTGLGGELVRFIAAHPEHAEAVTAARLLLGERNQFAGVVRDASSPGRASAVIRALGRIGNREAARFLVGELQRKSIPPERERMLVSALAASGTGGRELVKLAERGRLRADLHFVAAGALARSPDARLRNAAKTAFDVPAPAGAEKLPSVAGLMARNGDASAGEAAYTKAACITCHRVGGEGIDFGPDLTEIGNKLSREALFEAILYPSAGISHGFQGLVVTTKDGSRYSGYATGETDGQLTMRLPGGVQRTFPKDDITVREPMEVSLMPPGLTAGLSVEELVDLVAYLQSLQG